MPTAAATRRAPSSSPGGDRGRDGGDRERARRRARAPRRPPRARSPRRPRTRRPRSPQRVADARAPSVGQAAGHVAPPSCAAASARAQTVLTGAPVLRAARSQSACSGARLTTGRRAARPSPARARRRPRRCGSRARARCGRGARCARRACSSRAASRSRPRLLVGRPRERGEHEARAAVLHLRRRGPDVERAGGEAGGRGVGRELGQEVVEVGLDQRDRPRGAGRVAAPTIARTTLGRSAPSRVPAP